MRKLNQNDRGFIIVFLCVSFIAAARFFDHTLLFHSAPMGIMQNYTFSQAVVSVYFLILFLFFGICLKRTASELQKTVYYVIALASVVAVPMYLNVNYFGTMDVYAWGILLVSIIFLLFGKAEWIAVPLSLVATCICPMGIFYVICPMAGFLGYRMFLSGKRKYGIYAVLAVILGCAGVGVTRILKFFMTDAQSTVSWHQFVLILLLLSPYAFLLFWMWERQLTGEAPERIKAYLCLIFGGVPGLAVTLYVQDYARFFFVWFFYYTLVVLFLLADHDAKIQDVLGRAKEGIRKWLPVPAMLVIYPLIPFTLWVYGPLELLAETLLGK